MTKTEIDKWLEERNVTPDCKLNSGIPRLIKKSMMLDFQRETGSNSENPTELLYLYLHPGVNTNCPICGNPLKFQNYYNGYRKACSKKCADILTVEGAKKTFMANYGVTNAMQVQEFKEKALKDANYETRAQKAKITFEEKYGADNPMKVEEFKDKLKQTNLNKYGVDNYAKTEESTNKMRQTNLKNYGVEYSSQREDVKQKLREKNINSFFEILFEEDRLPTIKPLFTKEEYKGVRDSEGHAIYYRFKCLTCGNEFDSHLNNGNIPICRHCHPYITESGISEEEKELRAFIESIYSGIIIYNDRSVLKGRELDIYLPNEKLAIEYDGLYWHNEDQGKGFSYHLNKTLDCEKQGIRLIHIFSDEWENFISKDIIKSILKSCLGIYDIKIGARKCVTKEISKKEAKEFLNKNHLQRSSSSSVNIGLFYKDTLVSVLTFCKPRYDKKHEWELLRFSNVLNWKIVGGFSKMLKYFRDHYEGSIITYSDRSKFTGDVYRNTGFIELEPTSSNYFYTLDFSSRENRMNFQKKKLIENHPEYINFSEKEIMKILGYHRIYDCGNWKFELN